MFLGFWFFSTVLFILLMLGKVGGFLGISSDIFLFVLIGIMLSPVFLLGKYFALKSEKFTPKITILHIIGGLLSLGLLSGVFLYQWNLPGILYLIGVLWLILLRFDTRFIFSIALALLFGVIISLLCEFKNLANILSEYVYYSLVLGVVGEGVSDWISRFSFLQKEVFNVQKIFIKEVRKEIKILIEYGFFASIIVLFLGVFLQLFPIPMGNFSVQNSLFGIFMGYLVLIFLVGCLSEQKGFLFFGMQKDKDFWRVAFIGGGVAIVIIYILVAKLYPFDKQFLFFVFSAFLVVVLSHIILLLLRYGKQ